MPTDAKLYKKIVRKVLSTVKTLGLPLRQSYTFVLKRIYRDQRFRNHPKNRVKSFRNEYDGHTIEESLLQVERITGKKVGRLAGDRGYRGKKEVNGTQMLIPDAPHKKDSYHIRRKKHKPFCKRAGIEPTIAHMKSDFRLGCNFYKGVFGDAVNALLSAAAYNFKRAMRLLWDTLVEKISETLYWKNKVHPIFCVMLFSS